MTAGPRAPRFLAYFASSITGRPVLTMKRSTWEAMKPKLGESVRVDISQMPISAVAYDAVVLAATAENLASTGTDVVVYRDDPRDAPERVNVDRYAVLENVASRVDLQQIFNAASTEDNSNLRDYLRQTVFLVKKDPGRDHHLLELPAHVVIRNSQPC